jgi:hypothetical protein
MVQGWARKCRYLEGVRVVWREVGPWVLRGAAVREKGGHRRREINGNM